MSRLLLPVVALFASASLATAAPVKMTDTQLDTVVAGWGNECETKVCGNNGWGNGADGTNPGSFNGGTEPSKSTNGSNGPSPNSNPTTSNGR